MTFFDKIASRIGKVRKRLFDGGDLSSRLRKIGHLLAGNFAGSLIGLVAFALTARALGPADYGVLALCFAFTRAVERLVSFQSWQPLIKYGAEAMERGDRGDIASLLKFGLLLDLGAALMAFAVAVALVVLASPLLGISEQYQTFALIYCLVLPFQISGVPTAILRLYGKFASLAYGQVFSSLVRVGFCGLGVWLDWGLAEFMIIWMGMQIVTSLSMLALSFVELRRQEIRGVLSASLKGIRERFTGIWKFALSANLSLTIKSSANELDTLLVGYLADPASAGLFHIAKRIGRMAQQAGVQVQAVVYPELARNWAAGAFDLFRKVVRQTQLMLLAGGLVMVAVLYLAIEQILRIAAGEDFVAAAPLVIVQAIAVVMTLNGAVLRSGLLAMGRQDVVLNSVMVSTVAFHAVALTTIPIVGAMGANFAHIAMAAIWLAAMGWAYRRILKNPTASTPAPVSATNADEEA